jgi:putative Holliday junction resolvase
MVRWAGIDYGTRRIGLALADPGETIATPAGTLDASGTAPGDAGLILEWATENQVEGLVVGLPLNMDSSRGAQVALSQRFADQLRQQGNLPVELWDERLSSFQADGLLRSAGLTRARRKRLRDALAAQVILQSFLDARRAADPSPDA